jgi:hypothetical protein
MLWNGREGLDATVRDEDSPGWPYPPCVIAWRVVLLGRVRYQPMVPLQIAHRQNPRCDSIRRLRNRM